MTKKFEAFSPEAQKRLAEEAAGYQKRMAKIPYNEGRPELFETKIFRLQREGAVTGNEKKLLVATRDPGSGSALEPVLKELIDDEEIEIYVVTDGRAQEIIQKNFLTEDITPPDMVLKASNVTGIPDVILMDRSSEMGIDTYAAATFPGVLKILVEDYYANSIEYLSALKERDLPLPEKICVIDKGAKELITNKFPELEDRIVVTGQPAFDRFAHEDTQKISREVKQRLHLQPEDKIISFMAALDEPAKIKKMAEALQKAGGDFYFVFRPHPRDNIRYETYERMFIDAGVKIINMQDFTSDEIGAASDVVLTSWSTEGLNGIYRRKPTAHITDRDFSINAGYDPPLVPVRIGASVGINHMDELVAVLPQLLNTNSPLNHSLREKMEQEYPVDGKNAKRVADIIREYLEKK
ncbi:hypothetical protein A2477_04000 [Candidatus Falkowbacteria bacterium RIFOXYC2_FULL_47_12]|uniref:UDP-N-acetylglucosamine 2-epimerase domain-containing protein n=2 Tax=Candidatus Falkowiibacteriota TaxID=1752728 RepID=A0A1F5TP93_9BACT|nr:MAG: hypothetical protein A2242_04600 [Candidatus Falkowbacteria bacterium RIFOXYA2_FULL_47_9]OGF40638.1 MAG: hypothetical protein A2477_04000 [Candidatus Falkowbacteria bacterium RIFOXYC2_FULL_47_12]